jgi:hypothetical protein
MRYTQGEWSFDPNESEFSDKHYVFCPAGKTICSIFGPHDDPEDEANGNALLIAAAPNMLNALETIFGMSSVLPDDKYFREFAVGMCQNAIKKATGEQS